MAKVNYEQVLLIFAIIFLPISNFSFELPVVGKVVSRWFIFLGISIYLYRLFINEIQIDKFEKLG